MASNPDRLTRAAPIATAGQSRRDTLGGGFARWEHDLADGAATAYAGLGRVERSGLLGARRAEQAERDHRQRLPDQAGTQTTQLDLGLHWGAGTVSGSFSAFCADIGDCILIDRVSKDGGDRVNRRVKVSAGLDNQFDKRYAEHLSKNGAALAGYEPDTRDNEPGRALWVKPSVALD